VHKPGSDRSDTFALKSGVAVYGGFAGTENSRDERNWQVNRSILSGDIDSNDVNTDGNFIAETPADIQGDNCYHVVTGGGSDDTALLDGFTITAGLANDTEYLQYVGGGMFNDQSDPRLNNLVFIGNSALFGGGMVNLESNPALTNVAFSGNSATTALGGGMYNGSSNPTLLDVTFAENVAPNGGGIANVSSSPVLTDVILIDNSAYQYAGGIYTEGGALDLMNVVFRGNSAEYGGAMANFYCSPELTNVTLSGNSASEEGGGMYNESAFPVLLNVILWGNAAPSGAQIANFSSFPDISYSDIQDSGGSGPGWDDALGANGGGNIDSDPLFVSASDLHLSVGSPAIDRGSNIGCPTADLDGVARPQGAGCDMGAYEFVDTVAPTVVSSVRADTNPTSAASVHFTVTFTEAVEGVGVSDFTVSMGGGISGASVTEVSGGGTTYIITVNTGSGSGAIRLDIPATAAITDLSGNPLGGLPFTTGQSYDVAKIAIKVFLPLLRK
jgi:hypothetical protein